VRTVADPDPPIEVYASVEQGIVLLKKLTDIQYDPVAEETALAFVEDAGGDLVEDELFFADVDRVARICAALVASDDVDVLSKHVNDLPLSFISPLTPYNDSAGTLRWHFSLAR
tara:strand:- start:14 stop:355 length:342 start_codon:yes stop_codon:yes gene_type:complete